MIKRTIIVVVETFAKIKQIQTQKPISQGFNPTTYFFKPQTMDLFQKAASKYMYLYIYIWSGEPYEKIYTVITQQCQTGLNKTKMLSCFSWKLSGTAWVCTLKLSFEAVKWLGSNWSPWSIGYLITSTMAWVMSGCQKKLGTIIWFCTILVDPVLH